MWMEQKYLTRQYPNGITPDQYQEVVRSLRTVADVRMAIEEEATSIKASAPPEWNPLPEPGEFAKAAKEVSIRDQARAVLREGPISPRVLAERIGIKNGSQLVHQLRKRHGKDIQQHGSGKDVKYSMS